MKEGDRKGGRERGRKTEEMGKKAETEGEREGSWCKLAYSCLIQGFFVLLH